MTPRRVMLLVFVVLAALHQDVWLWDDRSLWLGVLPAGLGYHAAYSVVAALVWGVVTRVAWPEDPVGPAADEEVAS